MCVGDLAGVGIASTRSRGGGVVALVGGVAGDYLRGGDCGQDGDGGGGSGEGVECVEV